MIKLAASPSLGEQDEMKTNKTAHNGKIKSTRLESQLAQMRLSKDIDELRTKRLTPASGMVSMAIEFPEGFRNLQRLRTTLAVHTGPWRGGSYVFDWTIPDKYPYLGPECRCSFSTPCWHPNINVETGKVHLGEFTADWRPVVMLNTAFFALQLLFITPNVKMNGAGQWSNPDWIVNLAAAQQLSSAPVAFDENVQKLLALGGHVGGAHFPPNTGGWSSSSSVDSSESGRCVLKSKRRRDSDGEDDLHLSSDGQVVASLEMSAAKEGRRRLAVAKRCCTEGARTHIIKSERNPSFEPQQMMPKATTASVSGSGSHSSNSRSPSPRSIVHLGLFMRRGQSNDGGDDDMSDL
jgi:ubiquitin-protein ligase